MKKLVLLVALLPLCFITACKSPQLEQGGAYYPVTTNAVGEIVVVTQPEKLLYLTDATYKFAYTTVFNVCKFERDNRAALLAISPDIKKGLDQIRPQIADIDHRWALARQAYKLNPIPANLDTIKLIVLEIQRLIPVAQTLVEPALAAISAKP